MADRTLWIVRDMLEIISTERSIVAHGMTPSVELRAEWSHDGTLISHDLRHRDASELKQEIESGRTAVEVKDTTARRKRATPWRMLTGAVGLLKAECGIDAVDDDTFIQRKRVCLACDQYDFGVCGAATGCQCYLAAKIRINGESCPMKKWERT